MFNTFVSSTFALLFLVLACSGKERVNGVSASKASSPSEPVVPLALFERPDLMQMDKAQLLQEIHKAKADARKSDPGALSLLDRFENDVAKWDDLSNDGEPQKRATSLLSLLRQLISAAPGAFETQLQASSSLLMMSYAMENLDMDYKPVRAEAIEASESLVRRFPREDRAYAQLGHALAVSDETKGSAACAQFEACLKLKPSNTYCRDYLARLSSR